MVAYRSRVNLFKVRLILWVWFFFVRRVVLVFYLRTFWLRRIFRHTDRCRLGIVVVWASFFQADLVAVVFQWSIHRDRARESWVRCWVFVGDRLVFLVFVEKWLVALWGDGWRIWVHQVVIRPWAYLLGRQVLYEWVETRFIFWSSAALFCSSRRECEGLLIRLAVRIKNSL